MMADNSWDACKRWIVRVCTIEKNCVPSYTFGGTLKILETIEEGAYTNRKSEW